jgi:predicted metal-dependent hydrolase
MSDTTNLETLIFGSKRIQYELTFQERKTLGIRVYPDCKVRVIAPFGTAIDSLKSKLKEKAPWIVKQQQEFLSYHPLTPARKYINGETHLYLGKQYSLRLEISSFNEVKLFRGRLLVSKKERLNNSFANLLTCAHCTCKGES